LLLKYKNKNIFYDTKDKEQHKDQSNCGANTVAFIFMYYKFGSSVLLKI